MVRWQVKYRKDLALPIPWGPGRDHSPAFPQKTRWSYLGSFIKGKTFHPLISFFLVYFFNQLFSLYFIIMSEDSKELGTKES